MQQSGKMQSEVTDAEFKKPWRNWSTRVTQRPGTRTRVSKMTPSESLEIAEIAARIKFGRY